jgi:hypothetical protein
MGSRRCREVNFNVSSTSAAFENLDFYSNIFLITRTITRTPYTYYTNPIGVPLVPLPLKSSLNVFAFIIIVETDNIIN